MRRHAALGLLLKESDQIGALLRLLQASEHHLGAGNVLLGVNQVLEQVLARPSDACTEQVPLQALRNGKKMKNAEKDQIPDSALALE